MATTGPPPAHLSLIEGRVFVDREGRSDPAAANLPLVDGDRLRTEDGRVEVILPDGSLLHVDRDTTVDLMAADLLRLLSGRVYVIVRGARDPQRAVRYQIDAPVASVQTGGPGEFRVWAAESARGREVELAVYRGLATLASSYGAEDLRAGERSVVRDGLAPSAPQYFNSARWDEFDRWSAARRDDLLGTSSAQYLPSELTVYASTFDRYGSWRSDPIEGPVWYPAVAVDWRPYSVGYWRAYPTWNSFWIAGDPWGWPTHHYGYWGFSFSFGWYWKPARLWAPAWVYWAYSPGYVSWCPLGRYGYPVFGHFGVRGHHVGSHVDPWRGWTVVPRGHYGTPVPMHRVAVDGRRLDPGARGAFAARRDGPEGPRAVARTDATARAIPRPPAGGGMAAPRATGSGSITRPLGGSATPARDYAMPRERAARGLDDRPTRPSPSEAARVLANGGGASGSAVRRVFPAAPPDGRQAPRTEAPASTPDVAAFGSRRTGASALPRGQAAPRADARPPFGEGAPAQFGDGSPVRFGDGSPTRFGNGSPAQFGAREPSTFSTPAPRRAYPRAAPAPDSTDAPARYAPRSRGPVAAPGGGDDAGSWSPPPAVRQNPYIRGGDSRTGGSAAEPRAYPRGSAPQFDAPRGGASRSADAPRQYVPRDTSPPRGGGMPSGAAARPRDGGSSAPASAPRYNPGSGASQPRGGGTSSPPPRRRDRAPD